MQVADEHGLAFAKKTAGYLINSECIARDLCKRRSNEPEAIFRHRPPDLSVELSQASGVWISVEQCAEACGLDLSNSRILQDLKKVQGVPKADLELAVPAGHQGP